MELQPGLSAEVTLTVTAADTAIALGSGDVPVLGTPRIVALIEQATVAAVAPAIPAESTTVGTRVAVEHLIATGVGATVSAVATVTAVDGRRLSFEAIVTQGEQVLATGTVDRALVDRARFLSRVVAG